MRRSLLVVLEVAVLGWSCSPLFWRTLHDTDTAWAHGEPAADCQVVIRSPNTPSEAKATGKPFSETIQFYDRQGRLFHEIFRGHFAGDGFQAYQWQGDRLVATDAYEQWDYLDNAPPVRTVRHYELQWLDGHLVGVLSLRSDFILRSGQWQLEGRVENAQVLEWEGALLASFRSRLDGRVALRYQDDRLVGSTFDGISNVHVETAVGWQDGRIAGARSEHAIETFEYDPEGRLILYQLREPGKSSPRAEVSWHYAPSGALASAHERRDSTQLNQEYEYDDSGRLRALTVNGRPGASFHYSEGCPGGLEAPELPDPLEIVGGTLCTQSVGHLFERRWWVGDPRSRPGVKEDGDRPVVH